MLAKQILIFAITEEDNIEELTLPGVIDGKIAKGQYIEINTANLSEKQLLTVTGYLKKGGT